ncbi:hypothetical protein J6590_007117 [Homalodisca vitripennis]|nr:hypothetical protein J6590_007117 [Homalodisca vitripennis]
MSSNSAVEFYLLLAGGELSSGGPAAPPRTPGLTNAPRPAAWALIPRYSPDLQRAIAFRAYYNSVIFRPSYSVTRKHSPYRTSD